MNNHVTTYQRLEKQISTISDLACTVKTLRAINKNSVDQGYNRNLNFGEFKRVFAKGMKALASQNIVSERNTDDYVVILQPCMVHIHKRMKLCEPHMRCMIFTNDIFRGLLIDIKAEDWFSLVDWNINIGQLVLKSDMREAVEEAA